jgi:hypothetical protein
VQVPDFQAFGREFRCCIPALFHSRIASRAGSLLLSALTVTGVSLMAVGTYVFLRCVWDFAVGSQGDVPTILVARGTYKMKTLWGFNKPNINERILRAQFKAVAIAQRPAAYSGAPGTGMMKPN